MTLKQPHFVKYVKPVMQLKRVPQFKGWKDELQSLLNANKHIRMNGKIASLETQQKLCDFFIQVLLFLTRKWLCLRPAQSQEKTYPVVL